MMIGQDLTFDQLEVLLAIVDQGSFTAAARALGRTQGGVSYHVGRLEEQLELELFDRSGRRPVLTAAGALVVREARILRDDLRRLRRVAVGLGRGLEAEVRLSVDVLFPPKPLARLLNAFRDCFPTVDIAIETGIAGETADRVRLGHATVGVSHPGPAEDLIVRPSVVLEFVLVVAPCHPLAALDRPLTVDDLRRHPNLVLPTRPASEPFVDAVDSQLRRWRVADSLMRHELVREGAGWARLPRHQIADDLHAGRLVVPDLSELPGGTAEIALGVVVSPDRPPGPAGRWWVEMLSETGAGS